MKKELLKFFDKIDFLLKNSHTDYMLFELAFVLYEMCDDRLVIEKLKESDIKELRNYVSKYSVVSEYLEDKIYNKIDDTIIEVTSLLD